MLCIDLPLERPSFLRIARSFSIPSRSRRREKNIHHAQQAKPDDREKGKRSDQYDDKAHLALAIQKEATTH
jgi:hypothetical protein